MWICDCINRLWWGWEMTRVKTDKLIWGWLPWGKRDSLFSCRTVHISWLDHPLSYTDSVYTHQPSAAPLPVQTHIQYIKRKHHFQMSFLYQGSYYFSEWLTPISVWLRTQAFTGAAERKAQIISTVVCLKVIQSPVCVRSDQDNNLWDDTRVICWT